jgi:membrane protein involved in colicin uptake
VPAVPSITEVGAMFLAMSDGFWGKSGSTKEQFQTFLESANLEQKATQAAAKKAADSKAVADAKNAADAATAAAKEAARVAAEKLRTDAGLASSLAALPAVPGGPASECVGADEGDTLMADVLSRLTGEVDLAAVKRALEEAVETTKRRKLPVKHLVK